MYMVQLHKEDWESCICWAVGPALQSNSSNCLVLILHRQLLVFKLLQLILLPLYRFLWLSDCSFWIHDILNNAVSKWVDNAAHV